MGYGNGYPLFNFYGPVAYYVGAVASFVLGYIGAAKFLFFLPLVFGAVGMYFLAKDLFGKAPGLVGAILFLFAPYRALDSYVRGAVGESFALAIIPFVFFFYLRLIKIRDKKYFALATISTFIFFVSHNIMILIFTPLIIVWVLYWLYIEKWKGLKISLLCFGLAFGIAAFFTLPAFFEKGLVQTEALTRAELDFRAQFVKVSQLFIDRSWNYTGSQPQSRITLSYQIGWPLWWLVVVSIIWVLITKKRKNISLFVLLLSMFALALLMTHNKSAPIWEFIKILAYVQFPWRFLSIVIFSGSLIGAYFVSLMKDKWVPIIAAIIIFLAILLNWQYFRPEHFYYNLTDQELLSGQSFIDQQAGALLDYLPKTALEPREPAPASPFFAQGTGVITNFVNKSDRWEFDVNVTQDSSIVVPVFDFPNWTVIVNDKVFSHSHNNVLGRIEINLGKGEYHVKGEFENTTIRTFANILSAGSLFGFLLVIYLWKKLKNS